MEKSWALLVNSPVETYMIALDVLGNWVIHKVFQVSLAIYEMDNNEDGVFISVPL